MRSFEAVGTDPQRVALAAEVVRINARIHDRAMALVGPMPVPPDVTIQQLRVLDHVMKQPGLSGQELGALLGVSAPTASGLVERTLPFTRIALVEISSSGISISPASDR